jgi:hypothetical protein
MFHEIPLYDSGVPIVNASDIEKEYFERNVGDIFSKLCWYGSRILF